MDKTLKLYFFDGQDNVAFPRDMRQAELYDFSVSIARMGNAPTISAKLDYQTCLDEEWNRWCAFDDVFVTFRGEKYFLKNTPSSEKSNDKAFYTHNLQFVCERAVLESVYVIDDNENQTDNKLFSNNTEFTFFGDIAAFAERINQSMYFSGIGDSCMYDTTQTPPVIVPIGDREIVGDGYYIVVDEGVTSDEKLVTFSNSMVSDALSQIFSVFGIPYYFKGREIHVGEFEAIAEQTPTYAVDGVLGAKIEDGELVPYEYGQGNSILNVSRNNGTKEVFNRCSGTGSSDNIPYYYPNPTPSGTIHHSVTAQQGSTLTDQSVTITDALKFSNLGESDALEYVYRNQSSTDHITARQITIDGVRYDAPYYINFPIDDFGAGGTEYYGVRLQVRVQFEIKRPYTIIGLNFGTQFPNGTDWQVELPNGMTWRGTGTFCRLLSPMLVDENGDFVIGTYSILLTLDIEPATPQTPSGYVSLAGLIEDINAGDGTQGDPFLWFGNMSGTGKYWMLQSSGAHVNIGDYGVEIASGVTLANGDIISKVIDKFVKPQDKLMPSCYRLSDGNKKFYPAKNYPIPVTQGIVADSDIGEEIVSGYVENENYIGGDSQYYHFRNVMRKMRQKEHIEDFPDIKPTIKEMTNAASHRIDMFAAVSFDTNDDNSGYYDENNNFVYNHPYFFVKLRRFSGTNGFNLFDHSIDESEMTISMTSGDCAPCEFTIKVNDDQKNTVQVDDNGNLRRYDNGDVICGRAGQDSQSPQERQNDTMNYEVWIALEKDIETYGEIMPFYDGNVSIRPKACTGNHQDDGDTFVILHIDLPQAYVTAAEERLTKAVVEWMDKNNSEKFNVSMKFSRVFLGYNQGLEPLLSENIKVMARYNGVTKEYFVSNFSYKMQSSSALPEIELSGLVETTEELKSVASTGVFMQKIGEHISDNFESLMMGVNKPFYKIIKQNNTSVNNYIKGEMPSDYAISKDPLDNGSIVVGAGGRYVKKMIGGQEGQVLTMENGIPSWGDAFAGLESHEHELQSDEQCDGTLMDIGIVHTFQQVGTYAAFLDLQLQNTGKAKATAFVVISDKGGMLKSAAVDVGNLSHVSLSVMVSVESAEKMFVSVKAPKDVYVRALVSDSQDMYPYTTSLKIIKIS